jgi:hypothetical protein
MMYGNLKFNNSRAIVGCRFILKHPDLFPVFLEARHKSANDVITLLITRGYDRGISRSTVYNVWAFIDSLLGYKRARA